jgi:hypothetical protein
MIENRLRPSPRALEKALRDSATQAHRMAEAFGLKVPGIAPKHIKAPGQAAAVSRKAVVSRFAITTLLIAACALFYWVRGLNGF